MSGDASSPPSSWTERIATVVTTTKSIAITIAITARMNRSTIQRDCRRVAAWRAKKSMVSRPCRSGEAHLRHFALLGGFDLEQLGGQEREHAGDDAAREHLAAVVVAQDGVVEGLAREGDLVLGRRQLLGKLHHVAVRLEVRVGLRQREKPAERAGQRILGSGELLHRGRVARVRGGGLEARDGGV